jgi:DNA-binding transcriptional LysR family regulator
MDLWELKVFLTAAAERSFSRAAAKLYRTQPAVSQAIGRLERELGEKLFDRRTGALTTAGRLLQQRGGAVLRTVEDTESAIRELHEPLPAKIAETLFPSEIRVEGGEVSGS